MAGKHGMPGQTATSGCALPGESLCRRCDPEKFDFETTDGLEELQGLLGQARASEAVRFAVGMSGEGYNLFVLGPCGCGKRTLVREYLEVQASAGPAPSDWCYVNNFEQSHKPHALQLPAGLGSALREDMRRLLDELQNAIPALFESDEYRQRIEQIDAEFADIQTRKLQALGSDAQAQGIGLLHTPAGFSLAPVKDGEVMSPEAFGKLPEPEQERIRGALQALEERLKEILRAAQQSRKERRERIRQLNRDVVMSAVGHLIDELKVKYAQLPGVVDYLSAVQSDVIENAESFRKTDETSEGETSSDDRQETLGRYRVNLLVGNPHETQRSPVVFEENPTYANLVGRVEQIAQMGALLTDFNLIKPGALHRANGGYLLIDAHKLLNQPYAWEGLKRALNTGEIVIESLGQFFSLVSTVSLEPQPIPLEVKVVLFGERLIYYMLSAHDPEFGKLFKVAADFEEDLPRTPENDLLYARLIGTIARRKSLRPFSRTACARVIEHCARLTGDAEKLSAHMQTLTNLLAEADCQARQANRKAVDACDVQRAIEAQIRRASRVNERLQEEILRGTLLIDTQGSRVGQINGLSVFNLGSFSFGQPTRITATVRLGDGHVVDIQREVDLGGPIHSKGVLILASFLATRYASDTPLSLTASLVFEQTYGKVEGDSASVAELCVLLSALADVPIRQDLAVTGSVNQHGQVQAIGGVNEKIEGFFDICRSRGLTGTQGAVIPAANVKHLMLRADVVEAASVGRFRVYAVETVDQAMEILTGITAGQADEKGHLPPGTVNHRVAARLLEFAALRQAYSMPATAKARAAQRTVLPEEATAAQKKGVA